MAVLMFFVGILTFLVMGTIHAFSIKGNGYVNDRVYRATISLLSYIFGIVVFSWAVTIHALAFFAGFTLVIFSTFSIKKNEDPKKKSMIRVSFTE